MNNSDHLLHQLANIQRQQRCISEQAILAISEQTNIPFAQVKSVRDFYSFFTAEPVGRYHILWSSCTSCGNRELKDYFCQQLGIQEAITSADGKVSLELTSCIGLCDHHASCLINEQVFHSLTYEKIDKLVELITKEIPITSWPEISSRIDNKLKRKELLFASEPASGLENALAMSAAEALEWIKQSELRGRGGAGFNTALKWRFCQQTEAKKRVIICNADEGEPGTFKDRFLLQQHIDAVIEGMTIAAYIVKANEGFIYLRGEYRYLAQGIENVLQIRREKQLLGRSILANDHFDFDIQLIIGAGAYICGEESALIESLEQKPGIPRIRPPFPVNQGYMGYPTIVNNVETFFAAQYIFAHDPESFSAIGTVQSKGTKLLSISGDCNTPGIYEYAFGTSIQTILNDCGAKNTQAVLVGGPSGSLIAKKDFTRAIAFEDLSTGGAFLIFDDQRDLLEIAANFSRFFAHESCGFCTPCRVGCQLLKKTLDKILCDRGDASDVETIEEVSLLMKERSHCGLGTTASNIIADVTMNFANIFESRINAKVCEDFDLDEALAEARNLTGRNDKDAHL